MSKRKLDEFTIDAHPRLRTVFMSGECFCSEAVDTFHGAVRDVCFLSSYGSEKPTARSETVTIFLSNCPGGDTMAMFSCEAVLRFWKSQYPGLVFKVHCVGDIKSAAVTFVCSDVFAEVTADKNAKFQVHPITTTFDEPVKHTFIELFAQHAHHCDETLIEYYTRKSQTTRPEQFRALIDAGDDSLPLTAAETCALGLVDRVLY